MPVNQLKEALYREMRILTPVILFYIFMMGLNGGDMPQEEQLPVPAQPVQVLHQLHQVRVQAQPVPVPVVPVPVVPVQAQVVPVPAVPVPVLQVIVQVRQAPVQLVPAPVVQVQVQVRQAVPVAVRVQLSYN